LTPTRSPAFPPTFTNPRPVCPIAIQSQHHRPIASRPVPISLSLSTMPLKHCAGPSFRSPHVQASRSRADKQGLVFPLSPSLVLRLSFSDSRPASIRSVLYLFRYDNPSFYFHDSKYSCFLSRSSSLSLSPSFLPFPFISL